MRAYSPAPHLLHLRNRLFRPLFNRGFPDGPYHEFKTARHATRCDSTRSENTLYFSHQKGKQAMAAVAAGRNGARPGGWKMSARPCASEILRASITDAAAGPLILR
jgi:hypothetical protein